MSGWVRPYSGPGSNRVMNNKSFISMQVYLRKGGNIMEEQLYASIIQRILASIIDQVIIAVVSFIFVALGIVSLSTASIGGLLGFMMLSYVLWIIYYTYFEGTSGQTIGKKVLNIRVIKADGRELGFGGAFLRTLFRVIDNLPSAYILGFVLVLVTPEKQRLGDMVAGTVVIPA